MNAQCKISLCSFNQSSSTIPNVPMSLLRQCNNLNLPKLLSHVLFHPKFSKMTKVYPVLPVHIVEYHNEALEYIYRAIGSKHLPLQGIGMVHFDAHPDMMIPDIEADVIYDKYHLFESLSIENWIIPALYAGHIDTLVWLKADWAKQIEDGTYEFSIGQHEKSSKIQVSCSDDYFLSDCMYAPENELKNGKNIKFKVETCDKKNSKTDVQMSNFLSSKPYILDIDLDFFSTKNPIKEMFPKELYDSLKTLYEFQSPTSRLYEDIKACLESREKRLKELKEILHSIERGDVFQESTEEQKILKTIYEGMINGPHGGDIDAEMLHEFGCTCDDPELPHHVSSDEEVNDLLDAMETYLRLMQVPPTLVTISRSSTDEYCPPCQVDGIQTKVESLLQKLYGQCQMFYHYKEDS